MGYVRQLAIVMILVGVLFPFAGAALGQEYPVRFVRADKTGQKTAHEVTLEKTVTRTKVVVGDPKAAVADPLTSQRLVITAQFTREVVEASNSDHPVRLLVTFQKLVLAQQDKAARAVLPAGTQVRATAYKGDSLVFEAVPSETGPAAALDDVSLAMLGMLVQIPDASDDECFGTQDKKGAGSAWPVNQEALGKTLLGGADSRSTPDSVTGSVKVEKIEKVDGAECVVVALSYASTYKPAAQEVSMDVKDMGSKLMGTCRLVAPVDGVSPLRGKSSDVTSTALTHVLAPSNTVEVKLQSRTKRDETVKVVKK
jgi:hypothetical protein